MADLATAAAVAAIAGAGTSIVLGVESASERRKATREQRKQQKLATRKSRRQAIRSAQVSRAQATASAGASGAYGSSAATGGIGGLGSQLGAEMGYSGAMSGLSQRISGFNQAAADAASWSNTFSSISQLGMAGYDYATRNPKPVPTDTPLPSATPWQGIN